MGGLNGRVETAKRQDGDGKLNDIYKNPVDRSKSLP
jgi:hypothetical protein